MKSKKLVDLIVRKPEQNNAIPQEVAKNSRTKIIDTLLNKLNM